MKNILLFSDAVSGGWKGRRGVFAVIVRPRAYFRNNKKKNSRKTLLANIGQLILRGQNK